EDELMVVADDLDGVDRLAGACVEPNGLIAHRELGLRVRPIANIEDHLLDRSESHRQHRQQIWQLDRNVVAVWPPGAVDISGGRRLGLQAQSWPGRGSRTL